MKVVCKVYPPLWNTRLFIYLKCIYRVSYPPIVGFQDTPDPFFQRLRHTNRSGVLLLAKDTPVTSWEYSGIYPGSPPQPVTVTNQVVPASQPNETLSLAAHGSISKVSFIVACGPIVR